MKTTKLLFCAAAALLTACSSDVLEDKGVTNTTTSQQTPIGFNAGSGNVTRATDVLDALESTGHYNFGVFAYKNTGAAYASGTSQYIMPNYLVGFSNGGVQTDGSTTASPVGYYKDAKNTTWQRTAGTDVDNKSPWFYDYLGSSQYTYTGSDGYYTSSDASYMSGNENQFLTYWDLAYKTTDFYAYAPYHTGTTIADRTITVNSNPLVSDGYDEPLNEDYKDKTSGLSGFMYATAHSVNAEQRDVKLSFDRWGSAQLLICFYEDIPGWRVEILNLDDKAELGDKSGTLSSTFTEHNYKTKGIQAVPAIKKVDNTNTENLSNVTYTKGGYLTEIGGTGATLTVDYSTSPTTVTANKTTKKRVQTNLMFKVPEAGLSTASIAPANFTEKTYTNITDNSDVACTRLIPEKVASGTQTYSYSPTVYYPVTQPEYSETETPGFTFHISFRMVNEVTGEIIVVHDATVFVPPYILAEDGTTKVPITYWQNNTRYTYIFRITQDVNGTTDPDTPVTPDGPTPDPGHALHPIVFEGVNVKSFGNNTQDYDTNLTGGNTLFFQPIKNHDEGDGFSD